MTRACIRNLVWDHPRVCGKNGRVPIRWRGFLGSPPRVREKPSIQRPTWLLLRITPACAGKTHHSYKHTTWTWDHPRVCGKNANAEASTTTTMGSPPRVREKQVDFDGLATIIGITPACAGKTLQKLNGVSFSRDHPRVCGKNFGCMRGCFRQPGSPPRVREKLRLYAWMLSSTRITPACAGKTA